MKIIMLVILSIILCTSCLDISNETVDEKITDSNNEPVKKEITYPNKNPVEDEIIDSNKIIINKYNTSAINDNDNQIATDGKLIYYINPDNNFIYKINLDGTNNEIISEHISSKLIYYKEKLYFYENKQGIVCIDKDGNNYQVIYNDNERPVNNFIIHDDFIYMTIFAEEQEAGYAFGFYKYNLLDGSLEIFDDSITLPHKLGLCLINNKIYYNVNNKTREYDIKTNTVKDYDITIYDMQEFNNYIYTYYDSHISKGNVDNIGKLSKIYEISDDFIIKRISVIDHLIFFTYIYDYSDGGEKAAYVDVINIDGSNQRNLFEFKYSTLGHHGFEQIYVLNNNLLVMSSDIEYPLFKIFDFEGNELWSLY